MFIPCASRNIKNNECAITYEEMWCIIIIYITLEMHMYSPVKQYSMTAGDKEELKGVDEITCVPL